MDNMAPPPNSSPEEIQAWNDMMDTMVTFIKASTNLMNTITKKVRSSAPSLGPPGNYPDPMGGCEPECEACRPKPPCGICAVDAPVPAKVPSSAAATPKKPPSKVQVPPPPPPAPEEPIAEEGQEDGGEAEGGGETAESAEAAEEGGEAEGGGEATEATEGDEAPAPEAPAEESPPPASSQKALLKPQAQAASAGGDKTKCICAKIRAERLEKEKKDKCNCRGKKKKRNDDAILEEDEDKPPEEPPERLCGCGPTPGNTAAMVQEMVSKLANAQREITELQDELARLQRMDASKRVGPNAGPNPAALYKEIMKDTENPPPSQRIPAHVRQRLFQTNAMDTTNSGLLTPANAQCFPCDEELSKGGSSPFGSPQGMSSVSRPMMRPLPANSYMGGSTTGMFGGGRPMMRPPVMEQAISAQSIGRTFPPTYYPGSQAPCRRTPSTSTGQSPAGSGYSRSLPSNLESTAGPEPNYWSRLGEYGSPGAPELTEMTVCPSIRSPTQESPPRRRIICSLPPPRASSGSCEQNNCPSSSNM